MVEQRSQASEVVNGHFKETPTTLKSRTIRPGATLAAEACLSR
jgi:hypothetical protein